jgi:putative ATP-dependent endonuclease of the OLD family
LREMSTNEDAQAVVATHSPSVIRRVPPEDIRYLRLDPQRSTVVTGIVLPPKSDEAHKFVREAVRAYPELYFSRLVILGEGDSEEVVLQRLLQAQGIGDDESSISIVPLGGRHVNHFWRLLWALGIPHLTLLDLDLARYQGGWGRVHYASKELQKYLAPGSVFTDQNIGQIPAWNAATRLLEAAAARDYWLGHLEANGVYFSYPLDLDFAMLSSFPDQYAAPPPAARTPPDDVTLKSVLGKSHSDSAQYTTEQLGLFASYHSFFKVGSKPAAHLAALINISDESLRGSAPSSLTRLTQRVQAVLAGLPE